MFDHVAQESRPASRESHPIRISAHPGARRDVVFTYSYVSWQAAADRGWFMPEDRLARELVSHERIKRLLVCDLMRSLPAKLLRDSLTRDPYPFPSSESVQHLRPVRLRRNYPTSIGGVQRGCAAFERAMLKRSRRMGLDKPAVITANPLIAGFAELDWAGPVTFFATDDWLAYPLHRRWWPAYEESFARIRARGRRVCAVSAAALERIAPTGLHAVIPNGLDPQEWLGAPGTPPSWARDVRRPMILYAGSLDSRLDVQALLAVAHRLPQASVVLVGPLLDPRHLGALSAASNIEIHEPLARPDITGLIRSADVGIIPHLDLPLTRAMSPLKLYEYLAAGLPVVAKDLPPVRGVQSSVTLADTATEFADAVESALARAHTDEQARAAFIQENSWRKRQDELLDLAFA